MKLKSILIITAPVVLLFSSCLKKHNGSDVIDDNGSFITVIQDVGANSGTKVIATLATPPTETIGFLTLKTYSPRSVKPSGNVHAKLTYATPAGYDALPANGYTLASEFDIPKETGTFVIPIILNKANLDLSKNYAIQATLSTVSEGAIGTNDKTIKVTFVIKNVYDGAYTVSGFFFHPSVPRTIDPTTLSLATVNGVRSQGLFGDLGGFYFQFDVSGTNLTNWSAAGGTPGPANGGSSGFMTADNPGGTDYTTSIPLAGGVPGTAPWTSATYNNTYNAATKTFWMHYGYVTGVPGVGQNSYTRQVYEKWVKQ